MLTALIILLVLCIGIILILIHIIKRLITIEVKSDLISSGLKLAIDIISQYLDKER